MNKLELYNGSVFISAAPWNCTSSLLFMLCSIFLQNKFFFPTFKKNMASVKKQFQSVSFGKLLRYML